MTNKQSSEVNSDIRKGDGVIQIQIVKNGSIVGIFDSEQSFAKGDKIILLNRPRMDDEKLVVEEVVRKVKMVDIGTPPRYEEVCVAIFLKETTP